MRPYDVRDAKTDGTITWVLSSPAVAIELRPMEGNRGGFPVEATFNPDEPSASATLSIEGPNGEPPVGVDVIRKVTLTGVPVGDRWQLFAAESEGDKRRLNLITNRRGHLAVGEGAPSVLFDFDIRAWGPAFNMPVIYLDPVTRPPPDAPQDPRDFGGIRFHDRSDVYDRVWDLSGYKNLRLMAKIAGGALAYPADGLRPFVELLPRAAMPKYASGEDAPDLFWEVGERIYMGTSGNFGNGMGNRQGSIQLGAGAESTTTTRTITAAWSPLVRIGVELAGGTFPKPSAIDGTSSAWSAEEWLTGNSMLLLTAIVW